MKINPRMAIFGVGLSAVVLVIGLYAYTQTLSSAFDSLEPFCQNPSPIRASGSMPEIPRSDTIQIAILNLGAPGVHKWHQQLLDENAATGVEDIDFLVCITPEDTPIEEILQECPYETNPNSSRRYEQFDVARMRLDMKVFILNPQTGATIRRYTMKGLNPEECPDEIETSSDRELAGDAPTVVQFWEWFTDSFADYWF